MANCFRNAKYQAMVAYILLSESPYGNSIVMHKLNKPSKRMVLRVFPKFNYQKLISQNAFHQFFTDGSYLFVH
jgi:hypothetical protein